MSLIDEKAKAIVSEWAAKNRDRDIFQSAAEQEADSYYHVRKCTNGIWEYDINDMSDILNRFDSEWEFECDKRIKKIVAVAILRAESELEDISRISGREDAIPEFIYAF